MDMECFFFSLQEVIQDFLIPKSNYIDFYLSEK